jgi:hypothetical protein
MGKENGGKKHRARKKMAQLRIRTLASSFQHHNLAEFTTVLLMAYELNFECASVCLSSIDVSNGAGL